MIKVVENNIFNIKSIPDKWEICKLEDAVNIVGGSQPPKKTFKSESLEGYVRLVQIRDYKSDRFLTYVPINSTKKFCSKDDIMIGRYGPPVFQILRGIDGAYNVALMKAVPKKNMDPEYLFRLLSSSPMQDLVIGNSKRTAGQTGVNLKLLNNCLIPVPPLPQQQKIAAILDAADALRQNDKVLIAKYDELTQALFLNMFGDPVSNPKGWLLVSLSQYGSFKNGLNFSKNESGTIIKYLGVGDFKSKSRIDDVENLSNIELDSLPTIDYLLNDGDLVFVRSNGNKALVGRCVEVYPRQTNLTFSGFCIRYRIASPCIKTTYLAQLFRNKSFKNLMLESGQGANIQNINQQILSSIDVPLPPINLQNQFVERIALIEEQKAIAQASLVKSEELFNSLLQKAFKGELV